MRRLCLSLIGFALLAPATIVRAQEGTVIPLARRGNSLLHQSWLRFMVLDGRLAVSATSDTQAAVSVGNIRQHFTVSMTPNGTVLDYDAISPADKLQVHMEGDDQATLHRQFTLRPDQKPGAGGASASAQVTVDFVQSPQQPLKLTVTNGGETRSVEADSLWHLLMFEPDLTNHYLVPILELIHPDWQLVSTAEDLKQRLLQAAGASQPANRPRWAALVAQLADDHYSVRQRAEQQLRAAGRTALPYLQSLERSDLDAEQWRRISEIIAASIDEREDSPQRVASRLLDDRTVWLGFLADSQESTRRLAAHWLADLVGAKIDFDPAASAEVRTQQIAALRAKLLSKK